MPREKNSPFALVLSSYLRPLSELTICTTAPAIGLPSESTHVPLMVAKAPCPNAGTAHNPSSALHIPSTIQFLFIPASRLIFRFAIFDFRLQNEPAIANCNPGYATVA